MLLPPSLCYPIPSWRNWGEEILSCLETAPREVLRSLLLQRPLLFSPELVHTAKTPNICKASLGGMGGGYSVLVYQVMHEDLRPPLNSSGWHCLLLHGSRRQEPSPVLGEALAIANPTKLPREPFLLRRAGQSPEHCEGR